MLLVSAVGKSSISWFTCRLIHFISSSASGFTTRSDIGPAREGPSAEVIAYVSFQSIFTIQMNDVFVVRHKPDEAKKLKSTQSNSKTQTMNTVSLQARRTSRMTKKPTRSTTR